MKLNKNGIRVRTFMSLTLTILAVTVTACILIFVYFNRELSERMKSDQESITKQSTWNLESVLSSFKEVVYYLCCDRSIPWILTDTTRNEMWSLVQSESLMKTLYMYTGVPTTSMFCNTQSILFINDQFPIAKSLESRNFNFMDINRLYLCNSELVKNEKWYQETCSMNGQLYCFIDEENPDYIFFSNLQNNIYLTNPYYTDNIGVILFCIQQDSMIKLLNNAKITDNTTVLFLYKNTVLSSTDQERMSENNQLSDDYSQITKQYSDNKSHMLNINDSVYSVTKSNIMGDWYLVILIPESDLNSDLNRVYPLFAVFFFMVLFVGVLMSSLFTGKLTRPIVRLTEIMHGIDNERQLIPVDMMEGDYEEITLLYDSFNRMLNRIYSLKKQTEEEQKRKKAAELRALQAQINPHFIYNTLDSINCIALCEGQDDISAMVTALIDILKYSIQFSRTTVTLEEELWHLQRYIEIQKMRFVNSFTFECEIPQEYYKVKIPQIVLQPLVENALYHSNTTFLKIRIYCRRENKALYIYVHDNGTDSDASELNRFLSETGETNTNIYGIGIRNVDMRIRLNMGEPYGLHYEKSAEGGLDAIISLSI